MVIYTVDVSIRVRNPVVICIVDVSIRVRHSVVICIVMYQLGLDSPVVIYSLQLDQLCMSLIVFISFKNRAFLMRTKNNTYILIFLNIENTIINDVV